MLLIARCLVVLVWMQRIALVATAPLVVRGLDSAVGFSQEATKFVLVSAAIALAAHASTAVLCRPLCHHRRRPAQMHTGVRLWTVSSSFLSLQAPAQPLSQDIS